MARLNDHSLADSTKERKKNNRKEGDREKKEKRGKTQLTF